MQKCRAQTCDGAANMNGKCIGAAKLISNDYPKAIYIHCTSHQLNLCVAKSCSIQPVHNMMANVTKVNDYFDKSPKRMQFFQRNLKESLPEVQYTRIKDVCRTRWVERIDGLDRFEEIFGVILSVLAMIKNNKGELQEEENGQSEWNQASQSDADDLVRACSSFGFIMALIVTRRIFAYTRQATVLLQREEMDIAKTYEMIALLVETIQDVRQRVDEYHASWFAAAEEMSASVGGKPSMLRCCNQQRNRANPPASTPQEHYK